MPYDPSTLKQHIYELKDIVKQYSIGGTLAAQRVTGVVEILLREVFLLGLPLLDENTQQEIAKAIANGAAALVRLLDGLPLALDQAAAYIAECQISFADYIELYDTEGLSLLEERGMVQVVALKKAKDEAEKLPSVPEAQPLLIAMYHRLGM